MYRYALYLLFKIICILLELDFSHSILDNRLAAGNPKDSISRHLSFIERLVLLRYNQMYNSTVVHASCESPRRLTRTVENCVVVSCRCDSFHWMYASISCRNSTGRCSFSLHSLRKLFAIFSVNTMEEEYYVFLKKLM